MSYRRLGLLLAAALFSGGCELIATFDETKIDAGGTDATVMDVQEAGSTCGDASACDGGCADLSSDPNNCGACGHACPSGPNATATCTAGSCGITCAANFGDCNSMASDGCETDLRTDSANCGTCAHACPATDSGVSMCAGGSCTSLMCAAGLADCDMMAANGCEVSTATDPMNCGTCGHMCPSGPNGTATCAMGTCGIMCAAGFADCDGNPANGCETPTSGDVMNCGACGHACPHSVNAPATCTMGTCGFTCRTGYADCNHDPSDFCEVETTIDPTNCGACGTMCPGGTGANVMNANCVMSTCGLNCNTGFGDCDSMVSTGCETPLNTRTNCGACGRACTATQICGTTRTCTACAAGQSVCGNTCVDLTTSAANCGACGHACGTGQTCTASACTCTTGTLCGTSCVDTMTDVANCGACGTACGAGQTCSAGVCCGAGLTNCGGTCTATATDAMNCGACGHACMSTEICAAGACVGCGGTGQPCCAGSVCTGTLMCTSGTCM